MASHIYFVKQDVGLFRKGNWAVVLNSRKVGIYPDRAAAVVGAIAEAERTSFLGRTSEVWVNDGDGFIFEKGFRAQKPPDPEKKKPGELDQTGEEDIVFTVDDPTTDTSASY